jgi:hypothetical protein
VELPHTHRGRSERGEVAQPAGWFDRASIGINLAWEPSARAGDYYMVYLWRAVDSKPGWPNYAYSTEFDPGNLAYNTDYLWQVVAHNATGDTVGPIWAFRTQRLGTPELVIPTVRLPM